MSSQDAQPVASRQARPPDICRRLWFAAFWFATDPGDPCQYEHQSLSLQQLTPRYLA